MPITIPLTLALANASYKAQQRKRNLEHWCEVARAREASELNALWDSFAATQFLTVRSRVQALTYINSKEAAYRARYAAELMS